MTSIEHVSAYAHDPRSAAEHLAALCGGSAVAFPPLPGAWVCQFEGGAFVELYPRTSRLALRDGAVAFEAMPVAATFQRRATTRKRRAPPKKSAPCASRDSRHSTQ